MRYLIWRESKVALGSIFGLTGQFLMPIILLLFFATTLTRSIGGIEIDGTTFAYIEYFTPGLFGYMSFVLFGQSLAFIRMDKRTGILAIIALSKPSLRGYYWSKFLTQFLLTVIKIIILGTMAALIINKLPNLNFERGLLLIYTVILGVAIWHSIGVIAGVMIKRDDVREILMMLITLPLTFASSMYYNIDAAPAPIRWIATINPLTYICDLMRMSYLDVQIGRPFNTILLVSGMAVVSVLLAHHRLNRMRF